MDSNCDKIFPPTNLIQIQNVDESLWKMLSRKLIPSFRMTGITERAPGKMVKINLKITNVITPEKINTINKSVYKSSKESLDTTKGMERASDFFKDYIDKERYILIGLIEGKKPRGIIVIYYVNVKIAVYTLQKNGEGISEFLPAGMKFNPN